MRRLLSRHGAPLTWRRPGARSVAVGIEVTGLPSSATVVGVVLPVTDARDGRFEPATVVRGEAAEILTPGTGPKPEAGDEYIIEHATWKVVSATTIAPSGEALLHAAAVIR